MPNGEITIEEQRLMELQQARMADEMAAEEEREEETEKGAAKPAEEQFINKGEAILLLAFTGLVAVVSWALDFIPFAGWIINLIINIFVGFAFFIWLTGKIAKGAPKKWIKALYYGAAGSFFGGYFGAIIYLLIQDQKMLGKVAGKLGEEIEGIAKKAI